MKSFKKLFSILTCLILTVVLAFSCLACGPTNPDESDTPDGPGGTPTCNHEGKIFCDDCDKMILGDEFFVNYAKSGWSTMEKGKAIKAEVKDVSIEIAPSEDNNEMNYMTSEDDWFYSGSVECTKATIEVNDCSTIFGFDTDYNLYLQVKIDVAVNTYTEEGLFGQQVAKIDVQTEGTKMTVTEQISETYPGLDEELREFNEYENSRTMTDTMEEESMDMIARVMTMMNEDILPLLTGMIDENKADFNNAMAEIFDATFTVEKDGDNYKFTNKDIGPVIKKLDDILNSTVSGAVDTVLGEGTYAKIPQTVEDVFAMTVNELVQEIEKSGKSLEEIIDILNTFIQVYLTPNTPEFDNVTIDYLLFPDGDMSVLQFVQDNKDKTIKQLIIDLSGISETDFDAGIEQLKTTLAEYADKNIATDLLRLDGQTKTVISSIINDAAELIDDIFGLELVLDKDGNVVSCSAKISIDSANQNLVGILDALNANLNGVTFKGAMTMTVSSTTIPA